MKILGKRYTSQTDKTVAPWKQLTNILFYAHCTLRIWEYIPHLQETHGCTEMLRKFLNFNDLLFMKNLQSNILQAVKKKKAKA